MAAVIKLLLAVAMGLGVQNLTFAREPETSVGNVIKVSNDGFFVAICNAGRNFICDFSMQYYAAVLLQRSTKSLNPFNNCAGFDLLARGNYTGATYIGVENWRAFDWKADNRNSRLYSHTISWGSSKIFETDVNRGSVILGSDKHCFSNKDIWAQMPFRCVFGNFVCFASFVKGGVNQENADRAQSHAYDGSNGHYISPERGLPLRYKVLFVALVFAGFFASLFNAIRLIDGERADTALPYLFAGVFGIIVSTIIGLPLIF